jgi:hypothetical protein
MATILDKDLVRESTIKVDDREILVTITADQTISMKLKGMKSGMVSISIEDLYKQLVGDKPSDMVSEPIKVKKANDSEMMSLHDIRHKSNVRGWDYQTTTKFDGFLNDLIQENK